MYITTGTSKHYTVLDWQIAAAFAYADFTKSN